MERLCFRCWQDGEKACKLRIVAQSVADSTFFSPELKHELITNLRIDARRKECPNLNDVNPYYPGMEGL